MTDTIDTESPGKQCSICSGLQDREHAFQKYGRDEDDTYLPAAAKELKLVRDFNPYGSRAKQLQQCPECGAYYLYTSDYEYLVNGTEDEEDLVRLTEEQVSEYLTRPES